MHHTHLSLVLWFWAIYLCVNGKRGISACQLSKMLEIGYESAWNLLRRIRKAMGQQDANYLLSGLMEMDERENGDFVFGICDTLDTPVHYSY